ncbi:sensor histidine kinase [Haloferula sp. A504]|uniref:sensor histidine kinase n=1 Tax=Haloferula sp. A504 TaxID=3373601 RepID=UPI0031C97592|nr:HAMP domain-containing histidine kinase [Verrucomicrobiaceae bacterium E54]
MNPPQSNAHPRSRGGLFRRFILPQILITAAAGTVGLLWEASQQRELDRKRMTEVATANATFLEQVKVPRSRHMAENLSVITGSRVGFFLPEQGLVEGWNWSAGERAIAELARQQEPRMVSQSKLRALCRPIADGRGSIVVIEPARPLFASSRSLSVIPLLGITLVAIAAAFLIARSVVGPLQKLAAAIASASAETKMQLPAPLTRRKDEIGILAHTLVEERDALLEEQKLRRDAEKMALLGQLATSLAHEIKNPAAAIIMHAKALEDRGAEPEGRLIREDGEHITSLVNQWLFVARPEPPRSSTTDLVTLIHSLKNKLRGLLEFHDCRLDIVAPPGLPIACDSQRIEQAFRNLIDNAIKAMPKGGTVIIELTKKETGNIAFTVSDEGSGFSEDALAHFGETFYSEREGGMGLGLALAKGVIEAHGGSLSARNHAAGGALISGTLKAPPKKLSR